jgi:hypothetical protein
MSASIKNRANKHEAAAHEAEAAPETAAPVPEAAAPATAVPEAAATPAAPVRQPGTSVLNLPNAGITITVTNKHAVGDILTDITAAILNKSDIRQFTNNMEANLANRAKRLEAAKTEAEREANRPLTTDEILEAWDTWERTTRDTPSVSSTEKMVLEAALDAWNTMVAEHNLAVQAGRPAVIARAVDAEGRPYVVQPMRPPAKTRDISADQHKANLERFEEIKLAHCRKMLASPQFADRIKVALDAIMARKAAAKPATITPTTLEETSALI